MNWKNRYTEIKVGDMVKCIDNPDRRGTLETNNGGRGAGWQDGYEFKVNKISNISKIPILWGGHNGSGVYIDNVVKI